LAASYIIPGDDEAPYLVALCKELHALGSYHDIEFDWAQTLHNVTFAIRSPDNYICMARDGDFVGFVAGHIEPLWFSPKCIVVEDSWFVRQGTKDRGKIAFTLMRSMIRWALDVKQAVMVQGGDVANIDTVAVEGAYVRLGFRRYGVIYKYERDASCRSSPQVVNSTS
jgi:hypothetical protein